jgi:hypothetical protein
VNHDELMTLLCEFMDALELVFDNDWHMTKSSIPDIDENCTFLRPGVADESNNWANRGHFLAVYRQLRDVIDEPRYPRWCSGEVTRYESKN